MKTKIVEIRREQGGVLIATIIATFVVGLVLLGYITLVGSANRDAVRSQAWNQALAISEAGLEEAMAHLQNNYPANLLSQGWQLDGTNVVRSRTLGDSEFTVRTSVAKSPVVISTGTVNIPGMGTSISRSLRIVTMQTGVVTHAFATKEQVKLNGNNISTDSYDSTNPLYSDASGNYDPLKARDNGDISTNLGIDWSFDAGNADIHGTISTGPDGVIDLGPNSVIGSDVWHDSGNTGAEPGSLGDDSNVMMPDIVMPDMSGTFNPSSGSVDGTNYSYILPDGMFSVANLSGSVIVTGDATLYVSRQLNITGQDLIRIMPGASLTIYVAARTANLAGQGVINDSSQPGSFLYLGLPTNESLAISGNGEFSGVIYAPDTDLQLNGGGNIYGAIISKTATMNGDVSFHFDESLGNNLELKRMAIVGWEEI